MGRGTPTHQIVPEEKKEKNAKKSYTGKDGKKEVTRGGST